jgi:hypothetical protein
VVPRRPVGEARSRGQPGRESPPCQLAEQAGPRG